MEDKKTENKFNFTNDFKETYFKNWQNWKNWKDEFKSRQKFNILFNTVKSGIVTTTKKVLEMKVIKAISAYVDKHSTMAIITLWIMAIMIMASMLTGSIVTGIVYTIYLAIYTIMYFLLYHLLVIFAGLAVIGVSKIVTVFKKDK